MIRRAVLTVVAVALTGTLSGCNGDSGKSATQADVKKAVADALASQAASRPTTAPEAAAPAADTPVVQDTTATSGDAVDFAMPNFVGMNLQDAQDKVQTLGIFYSISHDLLGSRHQIIDSNWQVCTQSPARGTRIKGSAADYEGRFDFGSVKLTESCP